MPSLQSSWRWMDIVLTIDGTHTLANVVIVNLIHVNLVSWVTFSQGVATMIIAQAKIVSYCVWHPKDDFILLAIEIFGCLHQQVNDFLHCIDVPTWHGQRRALEVLFFLLNIHFISRGSFWLFRKFKPPLSCVKEVVVVGEASCRLGVLGLSPISLHDLLRATGDGPQVSCCFSGLPIVHFVVLSMVFCLDFHPFFFIPLFTCWEFFLFSFIYLFHEWIYCFMMYSKRLFYKIPRDRIIRPSSITLQAHRTLQTSDGCQVGWSTFSCIGYMVPHIVSPKYLATISTTHVWHFLSIIYMFIYFKKWG